MRSFILRTCLNALGLWIVAALYAGLDLTGASTSDRIGAALIAGAVLGIVNALVRPILLILTLPINILSLGLFTLVVNALMLLLTAQLTGLLVIHGFWSGFWAALLLSIIGFFLSIFVKEGRHQQQPV
ncbi:MAG: phage holin family protein [Deinococcus sp.]|nr:phage holin family protein [Deinococcus sp.]